MQNFKALVIYDEAIMRYFIAFCLKRLPYIEEVLECCYDDLDDVLKNIRPDVVITELLLSGKNGEEVRKKVHGTYPDVPIILITSFIDFLEKPGIKKEDFWAIIEIGMPEKTPFADTLQKEVGTALEIAAA